MDKLKSYRKEIDSIDKEILSLCVERLKLVEKVWEHKKQNNLNLSDLSREDAIYTKFQKGLAKFSPPQRAKKFAASLIGLKPKRTSKA